METANKHNKALEINSYYRRLDLNDLNTKKAIDNGVKLIISTDAHNSNQLKEIKLGIGVARRGWVEKKDVINTYSLKKLKTWLQKFK
ncbi:MAG: hypothetical protein GTO02_02770 [Candidatus Dadabacteria bacterium]|nr:hypothetical protein [Candidatus Dadabacteria bacterium]NIQ13354.1 hypothetical protein [Candidatus Dadabacteria bacterium]